MRFIKFLPKSFVVRALTIGLVLGVFTTSLVGQPTNVNVGQVVVTGTDVSGTCITGRLFLHRTTGVIYNCPSATHTWTTIGGTTVTGGTCTNQAVTAISTSGVPTCTTITSAYTTGLATLVSPSFTTPSLGVATATSINGLTLTTTTGTFTLTNGKTFAVTNGLTLSGTDSTTMTFPSTSATIARTDAANTFTGVQSMTSPSITTGITDSAGGGGIAFTSTPAGQNGTIIKGSSGNNRVAVDINGFYPVADASYDLGTSSFRWQNLKLSTGAAVQWNSDTSLFRSAAGQVDVGTTTSCATAANCRDLRLRHLIGGGTAPTVANTSSNSCGTTAATIAGTDSAGKVTVGATSGTSCTITFGTAYANAPACWANDETTSMLVKATTTTTTLILAGTAFGAGDVLSYGCTGY